MTFPGPPGRCRVGPGFRGSRSGIPWWLLAILTCALPEPFQNAADHVRAEALVANGRDTEPAHGLQLARVRFRGHHDDRDGWHGAALADELDEAPAVQPWHGVIGHDQVEGLLRQQGRRLGAV